MVGVNDTGDPRDPFFSTAERYYGRREEVVHHLRAHGQVLASIGCSGNCDGWIEELAAKVLARRIAWADNLWFACQQLPSHVRGDVLNHLMLEYAQVRETDRLLRSADGA